MTNGNGKPVSGKSECCPSCGDSTTVTLLNAPDRFHLRQERYYVMHCISCKCAWLSNPPRPEEMAFHYGEMYHEVISSTGEANVLRRWQKQRRVISKLKGEGKLLDVGCSSGAFLSTMRGGAWDLYGIEIEPRQAKNAGEKAGANVFSGDLLDAQFVPESFDVITAFHVLEHFDRPQQRIARIYEWLKPGGIFYLGLPNIASWEARLFKSYWFGLELPRHFYHYSPRSLRKLLTSAGFHEIWLETPGSYFQQSIHYLIDGAAQKLGWQRSPLANHKAPSFPTKALHKAFRLTLGLGFRKAAEFASAGANIEAVFQK